MYRVVKRDGRIVDFEISKIANAMKKQSDGSITVMPDILMFLMSYSGNRNVCSRNICRSWTDTLFSVTMISAITKNFWILIQKLKLIPEAS